MKEIVSFVKELYSSKNFVALHEPRFIGNEKKYVIDAIDSTFVSSVGAYVNQFEKEMAEITGAEYAIALVNGTSALHIALKLVGLKPGEEVLTQPLTFVATTNAIAYEKGIPHFIDVDSDTLGLSPDALLTRLKEIAHIKDGLCYNKLSGNRIAACIPMHTFGFPAKIDEIVSICNQYHIPVVEDAAESLGSTYKGQQTGTFGLLGTFSFNGNKIVTCGGGGAIVTNNAVLAKKAKHITTTAKIPHKWEYVHDDLGYNYRMPNINAALAVAQLENLNQFIQNKRETSKIYSEFFKTIDYATHLLEPPNSRSNYWLNIIQFKSKAKRDLFLEYSNNEGVMTRPIWRLMNELSMYKNCPCGDLSVAKQLVDTIVNIPSSFRD